MTVSSLLWSISTVSGAMPDCSTSSSVRRVPANRTSAALLLTPISSAVLGAVLLSDRLEPIQLLGAALILVGIAVASGVVGRRAATARAEAEPAGP